MSIFNLSPEPEQADITSDNYELAARAKNGAGWFYWIAALSVVNSLIFLNGGNWGFFAGLGITQIVDAIVFQLTGDGFSIIKIIGFAINLVIAGFFLLCGLWANKFQTWAFVTGMALYLVDGALLLLMGNYLSAAFHAFALVMIFRGLMAARKLNVPQVAAN